MRVITLQQLLFIFCFASFISSCEIINPSEDIPSYVRIDSVSVVDSVTNTPVFKGSQRVTDAWIFVDGILQGVYELPVTFPVLKEGNHKVTVYGGIHVNGIASTRDRYPFFVSHTQDINFEETKITTIQPRIKYESGLSIPFDENYESAGNVFKFADDSEVKTFERTDNDSLVLEGNFSGLYTLTSTAKFLNIETGNKYTLPENGTPVFLELNYKNDVQLRVGVIAESTVSGAVTVLDKITLFPTDTWKKIYINLTPEIASQSNSKYKIFFKADHDATLSESTIILDNVKLVHR